MFPDFKLLIAGTVLLLLIGCAGVTPGPPPAPTPEIPPGEETLPPTGETIPPETPMEEPEVIPPEPQGPAEAPNPRALASLELSHQAEALITSGQLDEAIRTLEQAVNLYPASGESYYYLAEAWRLKGNTDQAAEYNTLAAIRFKDDTDWMRRIDLQKQRIERMK